MLKSISINNYTTFIKKRTFDFSASKYTFLEKENIGTDKILKGALLVGENASGKTNVLKAILFLLQTLFGVNLVNFPSLKSFYTAKKNFDIEYTFVVDGHEIRYKVYCDMRGFKKEELFVDSEKYFTRDDNVAVVFKNGNGEEIHMGPANNVLFLRKIYFDTGFSDNEILSKWIMFLQKSVYYNCHSGNYEGNPLVLDSVAKNSYFDKNGTDKINKFLEKIKYRQKVFYADEVKNENSGFKSNEKFISFEKDGTNTKIPISFESTGNKAFISLLLVIMHAIENDCIIIIDEFSSGLHNELEICLLRYFFSQSHNSQIFFTTHSTNVLNTTVLRPDQIYSVKFDGKEGTVIKRFSDRDPIPRMAQNLERMYLNGEFDGRPYYDSSFEN